jgi:hypothetical protein
LNVLARLKDESAPVPAVAAPLALREEPAANVDRYDALRQGRWKRRPIMSVELIARLKSLKLHGMASSWPELAARARHSEFDPEQWMLRAARRRRRRARGALDRLSDDGGALPGAPGSGRLRVRPVEG